MPGAPSANLTAAKPQSPKAQSLHLHIQSQEFASPVQQVAVNRFGGGGANTPILQTLSVASLLAAWKVLSCETQR